MESVQWQRRFLHNTMFKTEARVFPTCIEELSASLNRDGILTKSCYKNTSKIRNDFFFRTNILTVQQEYFRNSRGDGSSVFINNERKVMEEESYMCTREIHTLPMYFPNGIPVSHLFA